MSNNMETTDVDTSNKDDSNMRFSNIDVMRSSLRLREGLMKVLRDNYVEGVKFGSPAKEQLIKDLFMLEIRLKFRGVKTQDIMKEDVEGFIKEFESSWKYLEIMRSPLTSLKDE